MPTSSQCEQVAVAAHRRRAARAPSMPRPGWCCSTCTAPPASSSASRAWRSTTRSSSAGRRRSGSRCPSWCPTRWPTPQRRRSAQRRIDGEVGWVCPELLDIDAVARLRSQTLQMPLPWVLRLGGAAAASTPRPRTQLSTLFRHWSQQQLDMRWLSGEHLFAVLQEAAPTGVRDADPAFWQARLDALRLANRRRPVRRGRDRLLRHLRGVAAVLGAHALQGAHQRLRRRTRTRRRCRWSARCRPASSNRA